MLAPFCCFIGNLGTLSTREDGDSNRISTAASQCFPMFPLRLEEFKKEAVMREDFAEALAQFENSQIPVAWKTLEGWTDQEAARKIH